jgi:hypothetical protein
MQGSAKIVSAILRAPLRKVFFHVFLAETKRCGHSVRVAHLRNTWNQAISGTLSRKLALEVAPYAFFLQALA